MDDDDKPFNPNELAAQGDPAKVVYIGNLAYTVKSEELREHMSQAGNVDICRVVTENGWESGRSRGFGVARFSTEMEANQAIESLAESELHGRKMLVHRWGDRHNSSPKPMAGYGPMRGNAMVARGMPMQQGMQGMPMQQGMHVMPMQQGMHGMQMQGMQMQAMPMQGMAMQGMPMQGMQMQGMPMQGMPMQGMPMQGMPMQGMPMQGMPMQGMPMQGVQRYSPYGMAAMPMAGGMGMASMGGMGMAGGMPMAGGMMPAMMPMGGKGGANNSHLQVKGDPAKMVYVGNLAYTVKWEELKEHMSQAGVVEFCKVQTEDGLDHGRSRGYGCTRYSTALEAQMAVNLLGETELHGRKILVHMWGDRQGSSLRRV
eukprot:TRINITY_DN10010_c0_g1_i1.p1 TRINITY_DN10010_c0_g1~~TRINITY_DN10010_c0_g1_i1.p1  ORF type:complete len:371 (+),score=75.16 TRINITY_DN10010_c0_g1_i1:148-1260(+)